MKMSNVEDNKKTARSFYDLMFNQCRPAEAIEQFTGDAYVQHNPGVGDGKQAFIDYFTRMAAQYPGKRVRVQAGDRRRRLRGAALLPGLARRWPLGGYRHLPLRRERQDRRALGRAAARAGGRGERQHHVLSSGGWS